MKLLASLHGFRNRFSGFRASEPEYRHLYASTFAIMKRLAACDNQGGWSLLIGGTKLSG